MSKRVRISEDTQARVLIASRRRCCPCVFLDSNIDPVDGQLAHVNQDSSDSSFGNLAFLCLRHHNQYDSKTSQSKGLTATELLAYRARLYAQYANDVRIADLVRRLSNTNEPLSQIVPDVLAFAKSECHTHLEVACKSYLTGYSNDISLDYDKCETYVKSRAIRFLFGFGKTLNVHAVKLGALSPANALHEMGNDPTNWIPSYIIMRYTISEFEQQAANAVPDGLLTYRRRLGDMAVSCQNPDLVLTGYAKATAYAEVLTAIRADLLRQLVALG
jgi:hypothetical protein